MITAIVLYDLPPSISKKACREHFHSIAPGFLKVPGLIRKQFIHAQDGGVAGGSYLWESRAAAEAFYSGPWLEGIIQRYGAPPRITFFDTFAIADVPLQQVVTVRD
jgi:Putative mono-oxygenase ydhR